MKSVFIIGIIVSVAFLSSLFYIQNHHSESKEDLSLFSWESFAKDGKYSWNGQELLKKKFPTYQHLPLRYDDVEKKPVDMIELNILDAAIGMYLITGNQHYLNEASSIADEIEKSMINDSFVLLEVPRKNMVPLTTNREALNHIAKLALLDSSKTELVKKLADSLLKYSIDNNTNLFYDSTLYNGAPALTTMNFPYGGDVYLESLLKSYQVTKDEKYLNQVKKTILAYWNLRDKTTNLLPSKLNATNNEITEAFMQQYGSGLFLKILLHYYYLTDDQEILNIIDLYSNAISKYVWNEKTWNYRTNYDGTVRSSQIEANFPKLDDALFLVYDLNRTKYQDLYNKAKMDYDNTFQNDLIQTENGLVTHSVMNDGSKASMESRLSYAFTSIQNSAFRLFKDTQDKSYLDQVEHFYNNAIKHHKREYGYVNGINAYTLDADSYHREIYVLMPGAIANKLLLKILPSPEVDITWTIIGNHKIPVPFFTTFYDTGYFNAVHFDLNNKEITLDFVNGEGTITFESKIKNVLMDGKEYDDFEENVLNTISGDHRYKVRLT